MSTHLVIERRSAASAASRLSRASLGIGTLGLATAVFLATRLIESWRIDPSSHRDTITLIGQQLSYPTANAGAIAVLVLAAVGFAVTVTAVAAAAGELRRSRGIARALRARVNTVLPDGTFVIDDRRPDAFCTGLVYPRVYITSAALARLDRDALAAVVAHERHHARRRDPLRLAADRVLARSLFVVPWLRRLHEHHALLTELGADESAAAAGAPALARAMLAFEDAGIDPARVDRLLGEDRWAWRFPVMLALLAVGTLAVLGAVALVAGRVAVGTATLDPPFLSRQPCVVMLAAIPAAATLAWRGLVRMRG
jgi:hypothetical protein